MKKITKKQLSKIYDKCLNLVKYKPAEFFNIRKMKKTVGLCNWTDIELDHRKDLLPTAYHECIHYLFPNYSETYVLYLEKRLVNSFDALDHSYFL